MFIYIIKVKKCIELSSVTSIKKNIISRKILILIKKNNLNCWTYLIFVNR